MNDEWKLQLQRARKIALELYNRQMQLHAFLKNQPHNATAQRELKQIELEIRIADNEIEELSERMACLN